jgi:hypothetical protein
MTPALIDFSRSFSGFGWPNCLRQVVLLNGRKDQPGHAGDNLRSTFFDFRDRIIGLTFVCVNGFSSQRPHGLQWQK